VFHYSSCYLFYLESIQKSIIQKNNVIISSGLLSGDSFNIHPDPAVKLKNDEERILTGTAEAEKEFRDVFSYEETVWILIFQFISNQIPVNLQP